MAAELARTSTGFPRDSGKRSAPGFGGQAFLLGILSFVVSAAGSWQPSYWGDEAASVLSAERDLRSLFQMLGHVDAVHGTYYLFLHFWIELFGTSELATRLPSAIAVGVAGAGTAVLARRLTTPRIAVIAGVVFAVLPRTTYMGAEARSFAFATAIAAWLTVLLVRLLGASDTLPRRSTLGQRRDRTLPQLVGWAGYTVLLSAGVYVFIYLVLLLPVHALIVLLINRRARSWTAWILSVVGGVLIASPVLYWSVREREQIEFLERRPHVDALEAAVYQWFETAPLAVAAWTLVLVALVAALLRNRHGRQALSTRRVLAIMLAWMLVPSATLLIGNELLTPMYALRYLSFCTPAVAVAIAIGVGSLRSRVAQTAALLVVVALAAPAYLAQRGDYAKNGGSDWRQTAEIVGARSKPGDAIVFDETIRPSRKTRLVYRMYPTAFEGLRDITLKRPYSETDFLWDETLPLPEVLDRLADVDTVWLLQFRGSPQNRRETDVKTLEQQGFILAGSTLVHRTEIVRMTRDESAAAANDGPRQ